MEKVKFAFHSAAAKAEKVITDFKTDHHYHHQHRDEVDEQSHSHSESTHIENEEVKHTVWKPVSIGRRHDWQEKLRNIRRGKKESEEKEKKFNLISDFLDGDDNASQIDLLISVSEVKGSGRDYIAGEDEELHVSKMDTTIPSAAIIKQLATAIESGKKFNAMKDLLLSSRSSSPVQERGGISFSAMKSLMLREKDNKLTSDSGDDEELLPLSQSLFDPEGKFPRRKTSIDSSIVCLPREIHGAPPESIVVGLSETMGSIKTLRKMALFWFKVITELRRLWSEGQPVPHVPLDESPDLNSCLLHQQLQVINCCISRKRRRALASGSVRSSTGEFVSSTEESIVSSDMASSELYAKLSTGDLVLRLGADQPSENLTMLETGELIYSPITQDGPILTEDLIKEREEHVLRTGSCGAGFSQLLSDMQAFKAANPGCILEDFIRWHSPPDWSRSDSEVEANDSRSLQDLTSKRGQLSSRMQKEGNLWRELWETAKPLPAVKQTPLFDEELAVEGILNFLEEITPCELFRQLFISLLGLGFVIAEGVISPNSNLSKLFFECKDYVIAACQGGSWIDNVDDLCQVYETVETILVYPEDCLKVINQSEESTTVDEPKSRFKRLNLNFGGKDRPFLRKPALFSRKPPKPTSTAPSGLDENDWTVV